MLARLLVLHSSPQFLRRREAVRSQRYAQSQSSAEVDVTCVGHTHAQGMSLLQKNSNSQISSQTLTHLVHTIQSNSWFSCDIINSKIKYYLSL